jgi:hypothetical protein
MNATNLNALQSIAGWATIGGIAYAIFGPRAQARSAVLVAGGGVAVGVITSLMQGSNLQLAAGNTGTGTGALPPVPAGAPV